MKKIFFFLGIFVFFVFFPRSASAQWISLSSCEIGAWNSTCAINMSFYTYEYSYIDHNWEGNWYGPVGAGYYYPWTQVQWGPGYHQLNLVGYVHGLLATAAISIGCTAGTFWNGSVCAVPTNGTCGSSNGADLLSQPSSGLCSSGTASGISYSAWQWFWTCSGSNGGVDDHCTAYEACS